MSYPGVILEFDSVSSVADAGWDMPIQDLSFSLRPGDLAMIGFDRHVSRMPVPDAAVGLLELTGGEVTFLDQPWSNLTTREAATLRGRIGRFFGKHGWVHHLDVDENVTLGQRHHTHRTQTDIESEALELAVSFGLPHGLPGVRPTSVDQQDLQRSACVRMLLGSPPLIVMDEPAAGLYSQVYDTLCEFIGKARERGAAVLWLSADPTVWKDPLLKPTLHIDMTKQSTAPIASSTTDNDRR